MSIFSDDSSRFAYRSLVAHIFATSGNAYDACQTDAALVRGTLLLIPTEAIVALADTWPVAVTTAHGALHQAVPDRFATVAEMAEAFAMSAEVFADAVGLANDLGFALDPALARLLG